MCCAFTILNAMILDGLEQSEIMTRHYYPFLLSHTPTILSPPHPTLPLPSHSMNLISIALEKMDLLHSMEVCWQYCRTMLENLIYIVLSNPQYGNVYRGMEIFKKYSGNIVEIKLPYCGRDPDFSVLQVYQTQMSPGTPSSLRPQTCMTSFNSDCPNPTHLRLKTYQLNQSIWKYDIR